MFKSFSKSFVGKFFLFYAATTLLISLVFFAVIMNEIKNHYIDIRQNVMVDEGKSIANQYKSAYIDKSTSKVAFIYQLSALAKNVNSRILIADQGKNIIIDTLSGDEHLIGTKVENDLILKSFDGIINKEIGKFEDYYEDKQMMVSIPILNENKVDGIVIMLSPSPSIQSEMKYSYTIITIVALVLLGISFISTFYFSRNISAEMNSIIDGTQRIASGDFSTRIELKNYELKELSDNMNYMANELENLENLRRDFISNISHDLRSPLTSIKGFVCALQDGTIDYEHKDKYLQIILDETERLSKLTDDIMLLTKMENDVGKLDITNFEIKTVIKKACLQFEQTMKNKNLSLLYELPKKEVFVSGDLNKIQRVITNILDNAIKFSKAGGSIYIGLSIIDEKAFVSIKDEGVGIAEEDLNHIWHRFHKADRSRGMDKRGTGLGLAIVQEIIKAHKEKIKVKSEPGKGSTFVFSIALADV